MKKIIKKIFIWMVRFFEDLIALFHKAPVTLIMSQMCQATETDSVYAAYQVRPKDTTQIPILDGLNQSHSFAIILQGPICTRDDMTINTVRFYQKVYPFAKIIVSTWKDESEDTLTKLTEFGATVVRSEQPSNSGLMNVNYQLVNSLAGVKKAQEMGCEYAVKTRTDQRICKPYIFDTMLSAINLFPGGERQKGRVITLGVNGGGMFIPFHTCDFLYFGYTVDLIQLFSAPHDHRNDENKKYKDGNSFARRCREVSLLTRRQISKQMMSPEIYILKHYCTDILKYHCEDTIESYWHVVRNYLICYGMKDVDLMWNKYDRLYNIDFYSSGYGGKQDSPERLHTMCFDFFNWLNLYMGVIQYDKCYEKYADVELLAINGC